MLQEFYNFFGPELTAVTGDSKKIDDVLLRVKNLVKPMKEVSSVFVNSLNLELANKTAF